MVYLLSGAVLCSSSGIPESSFARKNGRDFLVVLSLIPEQNSQFLLLTMALERRKRFSLFLVQIRCGVPKPRCKFRLPH